MSDPALRRPGRPPALKQAREARLILEEAQWQELLRHAEQEGVSVSALIRGIVDSWLKSKEPG